MGENFTLCDLNNFDAFLGNTFLDAYKIDILCGKNKVRICAKVDSKMVELNKNDQTTLANIKIYLTVFRSYNKLGFWFCFNSQ